MAGPLRRAAHIGGLGLALVLGIAGAAMSQQTAPAPEKFDPSSVEAIAAIQAEIAELEAKRTQLRNEVADASERAGVVRMELEGLEKSAATAREQTAAAEARLAELEARIAERTKAAEAEQTALREAVVVELREAAAKATEQAAAAEASRAEVGAASQRLQGLETEAKAIGSRIAEAKAEEGRVASRLESGRGELTKLEERLKAVGGEIQRAAAERESVLKQVAAARAELEKLTAQQAELGQAIAQETARRDEVRAQLAAAEAEAVATSAPEPVPMPEAGPARNAGAVQAAVRAAPGLAATDPQARSRLVAELEGGACVVPALQTALGEVNRQTAAALIRALGDC